MMIHPNAVTAVAVAGATALWLAPVAHAAGQYTRIQSVAVRCLVMSNDQGHGGGPAVAWERGPGFPQAPISQYGNHFDIADVQASGTFR